MTQQEKQLLIKDLCARLPYGVICHTEEGDGHLCSINQTIFGTEYGLNISPIKRDYFNDSKQNEIVVKPYLRAMSSMTKEEKKEIKALGAEFSPLGSIRFRIDESENDGFEYGYQWLYIFDFLNKHHFDYRGLIPMGLALEAPEEMYETK